MAASPQYEPLSPARMWVDAAYRATLERAGLTSLEAVMATRDGHCMRALADRENWRIELHAAADSPLGLYLKKHHVRTWRSWLRAKLGIGHPVSSGYVEARNVARLTRDCIPVMRLVAYGEKLHADGLFESFVITVELKGYTQLDHFLRERFAARDDDLTKHRDPDLKRLIGDAAALAGAFHAAGYNHRDLYCCHFFVAEPVQGEFAIRLIDLQRVDHRRRLRRRWIVKDLAQLAYSAPRDRISRTQRMAFIKRYLGVEKLGPADKRLVRRVLAKQRSMERHLGMHP